MNGIERMTKRKDGLKTKEAEETIKAMDLSELLIEAMEKEN